MSGSSDDPKATATTGGDTKEALAHAISGDSKPVLGHGFRLQWEPAQQAHVLLYPEGMVKLNTSAGEILRRCDGERTVSQIVADLEAAFAVTALAAEVSHFMSYALEKRWLEIKA